MDSKNSFQKYKENTNILLLKKKFYISNQKKYFGQNDLNLGLSNQQKNFGRKDLNLGLINPSYNIKNDDKLNKENSQTKKFESEKSQKIIPKIRNKYYNISSLKEKNDNKVSSREKTDNSTQTSNKGNSIFRNRLLSNIDNIFSNGILSSNPSIKLEKFKRKESNFLIGNKNSETKFPYLNSEDKNWKILQLDDNINDSSRNIKKYIFQHRILFFDRFKANLGMKFKKKLMNNSSNDYNNSKKDFIINKLNNNVYSYRSRNISQESSEINNCKKSLQKMPTMMTRLKINEISFPKLI